MLLLLRVECAIIALPCSNHRVACLSTHKLHVDLVHRPASNNIGVKASVDQLDMTGRSSAQEKGDAPVIISTEKEGASTCLWMCMCFKFVTIILIEHNIHLHNIVMIFNMLNCYNIINIFFLIFFVCMHV